MSAFILYHQIKYYIYILYHIYLLGKQQETSGSFVLNISWPTCLPETSLSYTHHNIQTEHKIFDSSLVQVVFFCEVTYFPLNPDWLIGMLIMASSNP